LCVLEITVFSTSVLVRRTKSVSHETKTPTFSKKTCFCGIETFEVFMTI
jgi:hypothetical protein